MTNKIKPFAISLLITLGGAAVISFFIRDSLSLYDIVEKPPLSPPAFLFGIVWTILYTLMAIAAALIWIRGSDNPDARDSALISYAFQLGVNFFYPIILFRFAAFLPAFVWLLLLFVFALITLYRFHKIDRTAFFLFLPYVIWIIFAGYLNFGIYILNK